MDEKLQSVYALIENRNSGEVEFLQAVREVFASLGLALAKHPEFITHKILERLSHNLFQSNHRFV